MTISEARGCTVNGDTPIRIVQSFGASRCGMTCTLSSRWLETVKAAVTVAFATIVSRRAARMARRCPSCAAMVAGRMQNAIVARAKDARRIVADAIST